MAFEATLVTRTDHPISFYVADNETIEKGAILKLSGSNTASNASSVGNVIAGIAAAEKVVSDGVTQLAVYREGRFKVYLSGSCNLGDSLVTSLPANYVASTAAYAVANPSSTLSGSRIIGIALESGSTGQTILMELKPMGGVYV